MRKALPLVFFALLAVSSPAPAQQAAISAGMTLEEVVQRLGAPARTRSAGEWRYLFYTNDCSPGCGSDDVVFLHRGEVASAVLRDSRRRYAGPGTAEALPRLTAAAGAAGAGVAAGEEVRQRPVQGGESPAVVQGIRVTVPAQAAPQGAVQLLGVPVDTLGVPVDQRLREEMITPRTARPDTVAAQRRERERQVAPRTTDEP